MAKRKTWMLRHHRLQNLKKPEKRCTQRPVVVGSRMDYTNDGSSESLSGGECAKSFDVGEMLLPDKDRNRLLFLCLAENGVDLKVLCIFVDSWQISHPTKQRQYTGGI